METPKIVAEEIELLKRNNPAECEDYFLRRRLSIDAAAFLIASRNCQLILVYARYHSFDSFNELALVNLGQEGLMLQYIHLRRFLWTDAEVALIKSGMTKAIKAVMTYSTLSEEAEVALLRSRSRELIEFYEQKWGFRSREGKNLRLKM